MKSSNFSILTSRIFPKQLIIFFCSLSVFLLFSSISPAVQIEELLSNGEEGSVEAQFQLGDAYYSGKGIEKRVSGEGIPDHQASMLAGGIKGGYGSLPG